MLTSTSRERPPGGATRRSGRGDAHYDGRAHGLLAQLVERLVYTEDVGGSSPSGPTL